MNEKDILNEIYGSFENAGKNLSDEFIVNITDGNTEERVFVVHAETRKYIPLLSACAAVALTAGLAAFIISVSGRNKINSEMQNRNEADNFITAAVTETVTETASVTVCSTHEISLSAAMSLVTSAELSGEPAVTSDREVMKKEMVTETEEYDTEVTAVPAQNKTQETEGNDNPVSVNEVTAAASESEIRSEEVPETAASETASESASSEAVTGGPELPEFRGARLVVSPSWKENTYGVTPVLVYEGKDYVYTIENPDRYLVELSYGDVTESFTLVRILNLRIVTIDELIEAGLPYIERTAR